MATVTKPPTLRKPPAKKRVSEPLKRETPITPKGRPENTPAETPKASKRDRWLGILTLVLLAALIALMIFLSSGEVPDGPVDWTDWPMM